MFYKISTLKFWSCASWGLSVCDFCPRWLKSGFTSCTQIWAPWESYSCLIHAFIPDGSNQGSVHVVGELASLGWQAWHSPFLFPAIFHVDTRLLSAVVTSDGWVLRITDMGLEAQVHTTWKGQTQSLNPWTLFRFVFPTHGLSVPPDAPLSLCTHPSGNFYHSILTVFSSSCT